MKVLVTSGGGAKGAFSVGVLRYLKDERNIQKFDLISGTSTGALIASLAGVGKIDELVNVYLNTNNADILTPQNLINSLTQKKPYIYDTEPLFRQIDQHVDANTYRDIMNSATTLCLNAISLQSGKLTVFTTKDILPSNSYFIRKIDSREMMIKALLASSNQAVFMNPIKIGNEDYVDGGNREVIPTRAVVSNLDGDDDHEIYVLSNNPNELVTMNKNFDNLLDVLMRAIMMFVQEVRENDLELLAKFKIVSNGNIKVFYICPPAELDKEFPTGLRFDPGLMMQWMAKGREEAERIIETTPMGNFPALRGF